MVSNLPEALRQRSIQAAASEPYWLRPDQYHERGGGVELLPGLGGDMIAYCKQEDLHPLGIVILHENGDYFDYINDDAIPSTDREFARQLFEAHAHFWFCLVPWMASQQTAA